MTKFSKVILSCTDCPFDGQDCVYCRTCSPIREALRQLSDVRKFVSLQRKGGVTYEYRRKTDKSRTSQ